MNKKTPVGQNIKVAADNCIFSVIDGVLHVLLIEMKKKPFAGVWALPGGLVGQNENLDEAAARILFEETNVKQVYLEQLYTFGNPDRDPYGRVITVANMALIHAGGRILKTVPRYDHVRWWKIQDVPRLAYDHNKILAYALKRLAWKIEYTNISWSLLPKEFTLTELQNVYESVLQKKLDKRNFRKKILALGLIKSANKKIARGAFRPAELFEFVTRKPKIVEVL